MSGADERSRRAEQIRRADERADEASAEDVSMLVFVGCGCAHVFDPCIRHLMCFQYVLPPPKDTKERKMQRGERKIAPQRFYNKDS